MEAVHSQVLLHCKRNNQHLPSLVNSRVKRAEIVEALGSAAYFHFAASQYRRRRLGASLLAFCFPARRRWTVILLTPQQVREHMFMYSSEAQHMDFEMERSVGKQALADLAKLSKPAVVEMPVVTKWLVGYVKEIFSRSPEAPV